MATDMRWTVRSILRLHAGSCVLYQWTLDDEQRLSSYLFIFVAIIIMTIDPRYNSSRPPSYQNRSLTIDPSDPRCWEDITSSSTSSSAATNVARRRQQRARDLALISEDGPSYMHPSLPVFLSSFSSITTLHISWHSLDWCLLPNDQSEALARLIGLESLEGLEITASCNFPLELLRSFSGSWLHFTFAGILLPLASAPRALYQAPVRLQALVDLSLMGQRNIQMFMDYFGTRSGPRCAFPNLESLCVTCIDDDHFESEKNLELLGSFLKFLDGSKIRELRVQDERPSAVIGHTLGPQELLCLGDVWSIEAYLCIKHPLSPREVYSALREWFTSFLSNLIPSTTLKSVDVTYQVIFPRLPGSLDGLIDHVGQLWGELDRYLARGLLGLEQVNVGFQFHGVGGHERWMRFNADNQPAQLNARGVDCSFWVRAI
ncbi:hypothetical protein P691DRAFT_358093 [Macrolepiota fuliginosa MF-IS2]|uniref:Uncharacterized protein n=1 Tax=Macrolepiota fuliginosa MF-IS2 TaxID=1400762 RepID=A0A9P6BXM7_9AGAR|nr:hypothetical protein P691DRAFT_358093 [Macrolepiota fuliginosa MF-IS2]